MVSLLNQVENMQNMTLWPNIENMTFYDYITFAVDFVGVRFLFENLFHLPEEQKKNTTLKGRIDGITDFGIALGYKHCNLAFCSFVLQINCSKTFSDGTRNDMWCKWLA